MKAQDIIDSARECIGTPFSHQGRQPGVGMDCIGLIRYPAVKFGITTDDYPYGRQPDPKFMKDILDKYLIKVKDLKPADVLWIQFQGDPMHLAIYTEKNTIIHAMANGPGKVTEHGFRPPWPKRVVQIYRYPGVEYADN